MCPTKILHLREVYRKSIGEYTLEVLQGERFRERLGDVPEGGE